MTDHPQTAEALVQIERELLTLGRRVLLGALAPGIAGCQLDMKLAEVGFTADDDLRSLYAWHNGTATAPGVTLGDLAMFPGFYLLSADDAVANYQAFVSDGRWDPQWLPLWADGGGDFYIVDCAHVARPIRRFRLEETDHQVEFTNLRAMLTTVGAGLARDVICVVDGDLEYRDEDAFAALARTLNPGVQWWAD